jgi:hypothetical protein
MPPKQNTRQLVLSATILGAVMLGFGLGAEWGHAIRNYAVWVIVIGAFFFVYALYVMQIKDPAIAKTLWLCAWICFIVLAGVIVYLLIIKNAA